MNEHPIVVFADMPLEGEMPAYLGLLLEQTSVLSPDRAAPEALEAAKPQAVAWITRIQPLRQADLEHMPRLRLISSWGVGYNHIDVAAATARRVPVCVNPVFTRSVSEAALTLILALSKRLAHLMQDARAGRRTPESERGFEVRGKTLGVVGFGRIGQDIGALGHRLEMPVIAHDPYLSAADLPPWARLVSLETLLRAADFVVLAAALTPETHHLIGGPQLALMKSSAYLINVGRGALVDEAALLTVLQEGRIAGAGLDVWEQEPLRPDHPLLALDNVIGTPHKLAATWDSLRHICEAIQANVLRVLAGEQPQHVVNAAIYQQTE